MYRLSPENLGMTDVRLRSVRAARASRHILCICRGSCLEWTASQVAVSVRTFSNHAEGTVSTTANPHPMLLTVDIIVYPGVKVLEAIGALSVFQLCECSS